MLSIAGSDSGGGAGIQADLKTFSALGCYGMSAITALTSQNTRGVFGIYEIPPKFVADQIRTVLDDIGADAVKIGMLHRPELILSVAETLKNYPIPNIILDPVMFAKGGDRLLQKEAVATLKKHLIPISTVLTPNLLEAEVLLDRSLETKQDREQAVRNLSQLGPQATVIKGGRGKESRSDDCFILNHGHKSEEVQWLLQPRIDTHNTHGTGCTFSSAIAAFLARSFSIMEAIQNAKRYISYAIDCGKGFRLGSGHGPVMHFHNKLQT